MKWMTPSLALIQVRFHGSRNPVHSIYWEQSIILIHRHLKAASRNNNKSPWPSWLRRPTVIAVHLDSAIGRSAVRACLGTTSFYFFKFRHLFLLEPFWFLLDQQSLAPSSRASTAKSKVYSERGKGKPWSGEHHPRNMVRKNKLNMNAKRSDFQRVATPMS